MLRVKFHSALELDQSPLLITWTSSSPPLQQTAWRGTASLCSSSVSWPWSACLGPPWLCGCPSVILLNITTLQYPGLPGNQLTRWNAEKVIWHHKCFLTIIQFSFNNIQCIIINVVRFWLTITFNLKVRSRQVKINACYKQKRRRPFLSNLSSLDSYNIRYHSLIYLFNVLYNIIVNIIKYDFNCWHMELEFK